MAPGDTVYFALKVERERMRRIINKEIDIVFKLDPKKMRGGEAAQKLAVWCLCRVLQGMKRKPNREL